MEQRDSENPPDTVRRNSSNNTRPKFQVRSYFQNIKQDSISKMLGGVLDIFSKYF